MSIDKEVIRMIADLAESNGRYQAWAESDELKRTELEDERDRLRKKLTCLEAALEGAVTQWRSKVQAHEAEIESLKSKAPTITDPDSARLCRQLDLVYEAARDSRALGEGHQRFQRLASGEFGQVMLRAEVEYIEADVNGIRLRANGGVINVTDTAYYYNGALVNDGELARMFDEDG